MFSLRSPLQTGVLTACAAAALAFAAPAAAQDPVFEAFQSVCIAGDGAAAKAAAAVEADGGWTELDPAMFGADAPFDNLKAWMKPEGAGFQLVMTGDMTEPMPGMGAMAMNMGVCAVGGQPADVAAIEGAIQGWTGSSAPVADMNTPEYRGYVVSMQDGRPVPVDANISQEGLGARMMTGELRMIMVGEQGGVTMVMYMDPKMQ
ncbi:MAG: hypothetical protein KJ676_10410 [Alphaproteobacteria bacterium]|nr:hypothetical protein [Alphaproteobacteria bacterium]MBU1527051.1 hypothetical protein [Alphaproteobacteria bacterium]MBU2117379.1 hypothetical protein [Alphaproteobacteria bacterium]MBU2352382.1 hypothetical protein [Alphaproteobacteria bacterium]MBU2383550.1 hypothetical protein [Alphaproteobacteria bacterium]